MTYEEALEIYKLGHCGNELSEEESEHWFLNIDTATELAFKCLEKQIPKKPYGDNKLCPRCKKVYLWDLNKFCNGCGQAIDWSDNE